MTTYTKIYVRPFLRPQMRLAYRDFISNEQTFPPNLMYRYFDPNFGVQNDIRLYLEFGIEELNLEEYRQALRENFYRRRVWFGDLKVAIAKDSTGNTIYEVVYVDAVDDLVNNKGVSIAKNIYTNDNILYPASIDNMRLSLESIVLPDFSTILVNPNSLPQFMSTAQSGSYKPPGYMRVIPICYTVPGQGSKIINRIKSTGFDFKMLDFTIDRIIVSQSLDNSSDKYLVFDEQGQQNLHYEFTPNAVLHGDDGIGLTTEQNDIPIESLEA